MSWTSKRSIKSIQDPVVPLEGIGTDTPCWIAMRENVSIEHGWVKAPAWECLFARRQV